MATTFRRRLDESRDDPVSLQQGSTGTQALITEQQVRFSTAAAVALPRAKALRWSGAIVALVSGVGSWFASAAKPPKPVYPKRRAWLENALMSREMDRL